ncbi:MAG: hemolysin family protein, partial [Nocardioidaceae bacterium]|nr:hemolysin family protein [Nocardioidaceae bacterium]
MVPTGVDDPTPARMRAEPQTGPASRPTEKAAAAVREKVEEVKPKLRGWLHAVITPMALAAGIVLVALSPTATT